LDSLLLTLVVILSIGFLVLLVLAIVLTVIVIRIMRSVQHISQKAEYTASNLSEVVKSISAKVGPGIAATIIATAIRRMKKSK
jgi:hypothetical protein